MSSGILGLGIGAAELGVMIPLVRFQVSYFWPHSELLRVAAPGAPRRIRVRQSLSKTFTTAC